MLLLAFNDDAAAEQPERVQARLGPLAIASLRGIGKREVIPPLAALKQA
jgi:hypothetical protein